MSGKTCPFMTTGAAVVSGIAGIVWVLRRKWMQRHCCSLCDTGKNWYNEISDEMWPGQCSSLAIKKWLYRGKSKYQKIEVFESETAGTVLVLDGALQVTTKDEAAYQETLVHTSMALMAEAKRVLVIGGGDGGVLREFGRYSQLEELHICELDESVIQVSKKFLPQTAVGFNDPRVHIHIEDGFAFLERMTKDGKYFDVIVADLSDPSGPAGALFSSSFLKLTANALAPKGVACMQAESMWLHLDMIGNLVSAARSLFRSVQYAQISVPSYPSGTIGALVMSKGGQSGLSQPVFSEAVMKQLTYFTPAVFSAQFVLPKFVNDRLSPS